MYVPFVRVKWNILSLNDAPPITEHIARLHKATFSHIAWLADEIPAYPALWCQVLLLPYMSISCLPSQLWNVVLVITATDGWANFAKTPINWLSMNRGMQLVVVTVLEWCYGIISFRKLITMTRHTLTASEFHLTVLYKPTITDWLLLHLCLGESALSHQRQRLE